MWKVIKGVFIGVAIGSLIYQIGGSDIPVNIACLLVGALSGVATVLFTNFDEAF